MGKLTAQNPEKGETLIEVLAAVVVATVLLAGLSIVLLSSLRNAQYAENQLKATKYAQEGVDRIRSIRDRNASITLNSSQVFFSDFLSADIPASTSNCNGNGCFFYLIESGPDFRLQGVIPSASFVSLRDTNLKRQILIENNSSGKKLTVNVQWSDPTGVHVSDLQTILTPP